MAKSKSNVPKVLQRHLLTPDQFALRCFAALRPDQENCADVMRFLQTVRPLSGCDNEGDERIHYVKSMLRKWIGLCMQYHGEKEYPASPDSQEAAAYDCATLAYWLRSIEPIEGESYCTGDDRTVGYNFILQVIEIRLLASCGMLHERPHRSTGEKFNAAVEAHPDLALDKILEIAHQMPGSAGVSHG